ncbi:MAG: hypothetical protein ABIO70_27690 [Pseudomonadota bacterium]
MLSFLLVATALAAPVAAACPAGIADLRDDLRAVRTAYVMDDLMALPGAVAALDADLPCLDSLVTPDDALQIHVAHAIGWWLLRDESRVAFAFRGALAIDPHFLPGDDIAPEGSALMVLFLRVKDQGPGMSTPSAGKLVVDGFPGVRALPMERAVVLQREGIDGVQTWYAVPEGPPAELAPQVPFGWYREQSILVANKAEIPVLVELRRLAGKGLSNEKTAQRMNLRGRKIRGEDWTAASVKAQLDLDAEGALEHARPLSE